MKAISFLLVGVAAEAYAAAVFARYGYDVSVQYGANQPEYDLIAVSGDKILKISVKGSQDGGWGLTQSYKKGCSYHEATAKWLAAHHKKTIFCLVQFRDTEPNEMPRIYLASPKEIAERMDASAGGRGETILYENHTWGQRAAGKGTTDKLPDDWKISADRLQKMFDQYGQ
jgi:Holliday junction resolvase-like predicted endonuclease